MDVKSSFLNGDLDEEIYMKQPVVFLIGRNLIMRLTKSLHEEIIKIEGGGRWEKIIFLRFSSKLHFGSQK